MTRDHTAEQHLRVIALPQNRQEANNSLRSVANCCGSMAPGRLLTSLLYSDPFAARRVGMADLEASRIDRCAERFSLRIHVHRIGQFVLQECQARSICV